MSGELDMVWIDERKLTGFFFLCGDIHIALGLLNAKLPLRERPLVSEDVWHVQQVSLNMGRKETDNHRCLGLFWFLSKDI